MSRRNIGRITPIFKGEWKENYAYLYMDVVQHGGNTYISIYDGFDNTNEPPPSSKWMLLSKRGGDGINYNLTNNEYNDY